MNEEEKKAARQAVNALVGTGNPDLIDLGLTMMPQEDKDNIDAIVRKVKWYDDLVKELVAEFPRLEKWLSREKIKEVVPGSSLVASDAMDQLLKMTNNSKEKVVLFFDTIILDDEALNISMVYLCMLPILLDNTIKQYPDVTEEELKEGVFLDFIKRLHAVPHVAEFPATPEALLAAFKAVFD
jgi:hypothetical protein